VNYVIIWYKTCCSFLSIHQNHNDSIKFVLFNENICYLIKGFIKRKTPLYNHLSFILYSIPINKIKKFNLVRIVSILLCNVGKHTFQCHRETLTCIIQRPWHITRNLLINDWLHWIFEIFRKKSFFFQHLYLCMYSIPLNFYKNNWHEL